MPILTAARRLGSRSDCQGQGRATLVLCKDYADLDIVLTWSYKMAHKSGQEVQQDDPSSWDLSMPVPDKPAPAPSPSAAAGLGLGQHSFFNQGNAGHDNFYEYGLDDTIINASCLQTELLKLGERELGPDMAALWTSGIVRPPLGEWEAVQGGVSGYTPGMRCVKAVQAQEQHTSLLTSCKQQCYEVPGPWLPADNYSSGKWLQ